MSSYRHPLQTIYSDSDSDGLCATLEWDPEECRYRIATSDGSESFAIDEAEAEQLMDEIAKREEELE